VRTAALEVAPWVAVIVAVVVDFTAFVWMVKVADVLPAGMVMDLGSVTVVWLLVRVMTAPPAGAIELMLTVPVLDLPPFRDDGFNERELRTGALTVRVAVAVTVPSLAVTVTDF